MHRPLFASLAAVAAVAATACPPTSAATAPVILPVAGLEVRLTAPKGQTWKVSSEWNPAEAHDLLALDPPKSTDPTYRIEVGKFTPRCIDLVNRGGYTTSTRGTFPTPPKLKQWYSSTGWLVHGRQTLGLVCVATPNGLKALVQVRLPDADPPADPAGAVKSAVTKAASDLEAIRKAFETPTTADSRPLNNPQVTGDGSVGPRKLHFAKSGLDVTLPADGAYWGYAAGEADTLTRTIPRMPALTARIYGVHDQQCIPWLDSLASRLEKPATRLFDYPGVPAGYAQGAVMWPADDAAGTGHQIGVCHPIGDDLIGVAMNSTPAVSDATLFAPLLQALATAAQAASPAGSAKPRVIPPSGRLAQTSPGGPLLLPAAGIEVDLPRVAGQTWTVSGVAWKKASLQGSDDELARWVRGVFVGGARVQLGKLTGGCREWQARFLGHATGGGRMELSGEAGGGLDATAAWGLVGSRPEVAICAQDGTYELNLTVWGPRRSGAAMDEAMARALLTANRPFIQAVVKGWSAGPAPDARPAHDPRLHVAGVERARTVELPTSGASLEIPDDGFFWLLDKPEHKPGSPAPLDRLAMLLPGTLTTSLYIERVPSTTDCADALRKGMESRGGAVITGLSNVPSGYDAAAASITKDGSHTLVLCHASAKHLVLVHIDDHWPTRDLGRFVPILGAIAKASDKAPATPPAQAGPQPEQ